MSGEALIRISGDQSLSPHGVRVTIAPVKADNAIFHHSTQPPWITAANADVDPSTFQKIALHLWAYNQPSTTMSLTYQPFAKFPEIETLSHELHVNVPDEERLYSGVAGLGLCALGMAFPKGIKWLLLGLGAALIHRGTSGHCPLYTRLMRDKRHYPEGAHPLPPITT
jgi:hypothetical protein